MNLITLRGRITRSQYFMYSIVPGFFVGLSSILDPNVGTMLSICALPFMVSFGVRRLHDTNMSGWWIVPSIFSGFISDSLRQNTHDIVASMGILALFLLIPLIISFYVSIRCMFFPGDFFSNQYDYPVNDPSIM